MLTIKKSSEFQKVFKSGKWYKAELLMIYVRENGESFNKIGVAVGRKTAKSVKRNRIKRLIRESYRINEKNFKQGYNIIIVWRSLEPVENLSQKCVEESLLDAFRKAEIA